MRIWTVHAKYLDRKGLLAVWREALLAQKVLSGETRGYRFHPQLARFKSQPDPAESIGSYLHCIYEESLNRGYSFDFKKINKPPIRTRRLHQITCTRGQLLYEWSHLKRKLELRDPASYTQIKRIAEPEPHPLFAIVAGTVESWEGRKV
jgi:hypothetical protein